MILKEPRVLELVNLLLQLKQHLEVARVIELPSSKT
jgi:hypothetical protein